MHNRPTMISLQEYAERRSKLMEKLGNGILILPSNPTKIMSNDVDYKYRQHSDLLYLCNYPEPNTTLLLEKNDDGVTFHLFVPPRDPMFETWNGRRHGTEGALKKFKADFAYNNKELEEKLNSLLKAHQRVFYPIGENPVVDEIFEKCVKNARRARDRISTGPHTIINPLNTIHEMRAIKSEAEIEILRKSIQISADAHTLAMKVTKPGISEYQIEAIIDYYFRKNGSTRAAYGSIVGAGENATILHYVENSGSMDENQLLLVDAGAEYNNYAADITRTWPVGGKFSDAQKEIYNLVLSVQKECINNIEVGKTLLDLNNLSIKLITQGLVKLGLLEGEVEELIKENKHRRYYMHGLSHWLGIDVHDTPFLVRDAKIQIGNCFTVEPGIYIPVEDDIPEKYRGIGVRIEDDVLVTNNGVEILSEGVVKEIGEIEALVGTSDLP